MFTEDQNKEIRMPERERLDTIIAHENSIQIAGTDEDTKVIDLSDTKILKEVSRCRDRVEAELIRQQLDREKEVRTRETERFVQNYIRTIEESYKKFETGDTYEK